MRRKTFNLTKATLVIMFITMLALIALSGTYAKYTTTASGTGTVIVAKWDVSTAINGIATTNAEFNLYDTITDSDLKTKGQAKLFTNRIAPGTSGSFDLSLTSKSEVGAVVDVEITPVNGNELPAYLKFKMTKPNGDEDELDMTSGVISVKGIVIPAVDRNGGQPNTKTVTIDWEWPYETGDVTDGVAAGDAQDTTDGINGNTCMFNVKITGTQVDPSTTVVPNP